jgi:hypothetical protein
VEIVQLKQATKKTEKDSIRSDGENARNQRTKSALLRTSTMGKESAKKTRHKSSKVPLSESATVSKKNKTSVRKCGTCRQPGHTAATCSMPKMTKRKVDKLLNWDDEALDAPVSKKVKAVKLFDW